MTIVKETYENAAKDVAEELDTLKEVVTEVDEEEERQKRIWKDLERLSKDMVKWSEEEDKRREESKEELDAYYRGV